MVAHDVRAWGSQVQILPLRPTLSQIVVLVTGSFTDRNDRRVSRWPLAGTRSRSTMHKAHHPMAEVLQCIVQLELRFVAQKAFGPSEVGATVTVR